MLFRKIVGTLRSLGFKFRKFDLTSNDIIVGYVSALPGGDGTMLHSVHIVGVRRLAISDSPVLIC